MMENPKELIKSGENDLENISFSYFITKYDIIAPSPSGGIGRRASFRC